MGWTDLVKKNVKDGLDGTWLGKLVDNFAYLFARTTLISGLLNGGFEADADGDGEPDGITITNLAGSGSHSIDTSTVAEGAQSIKCTRQSGAGNGGASIEFDLFPVSPGTYQLDFYYAADAALKSTYQIKWYDESQSYLSTTTVKSIEIETVMRGIVEAGTIPGGARFAEVYLVGGTTDVNPGVTANCYFDAVDFKQTSINNPVFDGSENSSGSVGWVTLHTIPMYIPADAASLAVTVDVKSTSTGGPLTVYYRAELDTAVGSEQSTTSTSYVSKTSSLTIAAGSKGTIANILIRGKAITDASPPTCTIKQTSSSTNGYEAKISITN